MISPAEGSIVVLSAIALSGVWIILTVLWPHMEAAKLRARIMELRRDGIGEELYQQAMRYSAVIGLTRIALGRIFRAQGGDSTRRADAIPPGEIRLRLTLSRHMFVGSPGGWVMLLAVFIVWVMRGRRGRFWDAADGMLPGRPDPYELLWPEGRPAGLR